MDQGPAILTLYSILMFLMIAAIPVVSIMMIVSYVVKTAKRGIREITK